MSEPKLWINPYEKDVEEAFENSYKLLMKEVTYEDLGNHFLLPENHCEDEILLFYKPNTFL